LVSKDHSQALRWYRLSAQKGFPNAQINVGHCFHEGLGVERDESMAAWWVSQAAEQGDAGAQSHLGSRYVHGVGVEKSDFDAFFWLDLAAKGGNEEAIAARTRMTLQIAPVRTGTTRKRLRIAQLEAKNGC
jgi:TPR repeat protein